VTEPASATSSCRDNNEEGTSAGFMEMSSEIIRPFRTAGGRKQDPDGHAREDGSEKGKSKYSERTLENITVKKRVITVGSSDYC
jgi:hypothetical protein